MAPSKSTANRKRSRNAIITAAIALIASASPLLSITYLESKAPLRHYLQFIQAATNDPPHHHEDAENGNATTNRTRTDRQQSIIATPPQSIGARQRQQTTATTTTAASNHSHSPACRPHYKVALSDGSWTTNVKFKRIYFYHARKAGGTNLRFYLEKVAKHHGLEYEAEEFTMAEDPGHNSYNNNTPTLYVANLREPVSRSISHFKYEGRWDCESLLYNTSYLPTTQNAASITTWNQHYGHIPAACRMERNGAYKFKMDKCAVNCYTQWYSGLSCPWWEMPPGVNVTAENFTGYRPIRKQMATERMYEVAISKLRRYNFVIITELLRNPMYVEAIERYFGVPGLNERKLSPWCEVESHYANEVVPLVVPKETLANLTALNEVDVRLYHEMKDCLVDDDGTLVEGGGGGYANFPAWDASRFERNESIQVDYKTFERTGKQTYLKPQKWWLEKFKTNASDGNV